MINKNDIPEKIQPTKKCKHKNNYHIYKASTIGYYILTAHSKKWAVPIFSVYYFKLTF